MPSGRRRNELAVHGYVVPVLNKVIYLLPRMSLPGTRMLGVQKKIRSQVAAFKSAGFDVRVIDGARKSALPDYADSRVVNKDESGSSSDSRFSILRDKTRTATDLLRSVLQEGDAIIYMRHTCTTPGLVLFYALLRLLPGKRRIYLEIPTWPYRHETFVNASDRMLSPLLRFLVHDIVTFSSSDTIYGISTIRITNGVSEKSTPLIPIPGDDRQVFTMVCVAHMHEWVGLDRLLTGLGRYLVRNGAHRNIEVRLAGEGHKQAEWELLSRELGLEDVVRFYGNCSGARLESLFQDVHVAIGNLGNHRRGLSENADLKNREYCMRGLPFVVAAGDPAFPESFPYMLRQPADDSPLDVPAIIEFHERVSELEPDYNQQMRTFAMKHFEWEQVMRPVVDDMKAHVA